MNLASLSLSALLKLETDLPTAIANAKSRERDKLRATIERSLEGTGFKLADLIGKQTPRKNAPVKPKYKSKDGKTWSGRGRAPKWMPKNKNDWTSVAI